MGTSVLSMPWGINQAGPIPASIIMLIMLFICFYSAYLVLKSPIVLEKSLEKKLQNTSNTSSHSTSDHQKNKLLNQIKNNIEEFSDICYYLIGPKGQYLAVISAILAFFG